MMSKINWTMDRTKTGRILLRLIGVCHFDVIQIRDHLFSNIAIKELYSQKSASRQRSFLRAVYSFQNLLLKMCQRVHINVNIKNTGYFFNAPVPIKQRPYHIRQICQNCIILLKHLQNSYKLNAKTLVKVDRVVFYTYLLTKVRQLLELVLMDCNI